MTLDEMTKKMQAEFEKRYRFYRLGPGNLPVRCTWQEWIANLDDGDRQVGYTLVGDKRVSTIFWGMIRQSSISPGGMFESKVFIGDKAIAGDQYETWDEAMKGHARIVAALQLEGFV